MATKKTNTKKAASRKKAATKKTPAKASRSKKAKPAEAKRDGKLSAINAAAKVLGETKKALNCKELVEAMAANGYWKSPGGQTPDRTLYPSSCVLVLSSISYVRRSQ